MFTKALLVSLIGVSVVVSCLLTLILIVVVLKFVFPPESEPAEVEAEKSRDVEEVIAGAAPDVIIAIVAVERHRRQMNLGRVNFNEDKQIE